MIAPVVDIEWLLEHRDAVILADVRWYLDGRSGREGYASGHLPGAVFIDIERWLSGEACDAGGRHPLPEPAVFAEGMSRAGIGDDDLVIAYDDAGGVIAARLVWMLRATGHAAALLDGGLAAWPGAQDATPATPGHATFTPRDWPAERLASIDDVTSAGVVAVDARPAERYRGGADALDPRSGHIPGARSVPCRENLGADDRFLPTDELRARFAGVGVHNGASVVSYCGSGVTACHNLLALEHAGLGVGRLFPGSWSQWSRDAARPVATGESP